MPIRPEFRAFYGHEWRTVTRPKILKRSDYRCERCGRPAPKYKLEIAHLVEQPPAAGHDADDNLASLCVPCHKAHDYPEWAAKCHETRSARKDAARPLLQEAFAV